jgi:AcrR family transcriptional regulator
MAGKLSPRSSARPSSARPDDQSGASATRGRLLDAAESLFGQHGFEAASVRAITRRARANLGAITYHFGSKEELYLEAFFRRVRPINAQRLATLAALRETVPLGQPLPVRAILECLLRGPLLVAREHPRFLPLLAQNLTRPPDFAQARIGAEMDPLQSPFMRELVQALPGLPPPVLAFRLILTGGGLFFLLNHWPKLAAAALAGPRLFTPGDPAAIEAALALLLDFAEAGLLAPVGPTPFPRP